MKNIYYFVHSTSTDNEKGVVSGHYDCALSPLGQKQAHDLSLTIQESNIDFGEIYSSPLERALETARILFPNQEISLDTRLKEIDYGNLTHSTKEHIDTLRHKYIDESFPHGESYTDVKNRITHFLQTIEVPTITVVSHQAPQLALEAITNGISLDEAMNHDWRKKERGWKPFWPYRITMVA